MDEKGVLSERSSAFLARVRADLESKSPAEIACRIRALVAAHDVWRSRSLNMNPAESLLSHGCRQLLASDLATRLTEGLPGDKAYPHGRQNEYVDELEASVITLAQDLFHAKYVEWRPVSTTMAMAAVFNALVSRGDTILAQAEDGGGNFSYHEHGPAGVLGVHFTDIPWRGSTFEVQAEAVAEQAQKTRPKAIVVGGSNVLFPYPVRELRRIADSVGAVLIYDAAHLGLLISAGEFQRPLAEGAHVVVASTHKVMGGPVGGLVLTNDADLARRIVRLTFPGLMQTRDQNKYAALALALTEARAFGAELAAQMIVNARALADALAERGFALIAQERRYTQTHQVFLELGEGAKSFETRCQEADILVSDCALAGDLALRRRSGARLAVHELTRLGMREAEMEKVADLMHRAFSGVHAAMISADVAALLERHRHIQFSFDRQKD